MAISNEVDGRRTEAPLHQWFVEVDPKNPLYETLAAQLSYFLAEFGKAPSSKIRISILPDVVSTDKMVIDHQDKIVELILAVAETLQPQQLSELRHRLAAR